MTDLQDIDGIGPSYAEELASNGYESVEDLADADPDVVDDLIETLDGADAVESAQALVVSDGDGAAEDDGDTDVYEIEPGFDEDQRNHLIRALVREEVQARRQNKSSRAEQTRDAIQQVIDGEPYAMTMGQLDTAYRAVNQLEQEYRGTRGLGSFTTKIRSVRDTFKDARQANWD